MRKRTGARVWPATFERHNGNVDGTGMPTYFNPADWSVLYGGEYVLGEFIDVSAGETVRGRQVTSSTTNVFICEFFDVQDVVVTDRMILNGVTYSLNTADDPSGLQREKWLEAKQESN